MPKFGTKRVLKNYCNIWNQHPQSTKTICSLISRITITINSPADINICRYIYVIYIHINICKYISYLRYYMNWNQVVFVKMLVNAHAKFFYFLFQFHLHAVFISNPFINNARLKLEKNQVNAKQHPETELLLFVNYSFFIFVFIQ